MRTFPVMLNVIASRAVVVGAGAIGMRRVKSLHNAGADVTLVAIAPPLRTPPEGVTVVLEPYRAELLAGAKLVFACTDDREVNARIAADARAAGALVTAADQPDDCDFFMPAIAADGDVIVAVGTGGLAPSLAKWLRDRCSDALPERIGEFAAALDKCRQKLKTTEPDDQRRMALQRTLMTEETYQAFLAGGAGAVRKRLDNLLTEIDT